MVSRKKNNSEMEMESDSEADIKSAGEKLRI